jgi:hypothetical protein
MSLIQKKKNLRDLLAEARQEDAFDGLFDQVKDSSSAVLDALCVLKGRFKKNEKSWGANIIDQRDYDLESSRINAALLALINELRESDLKDDFAEALASIQKMPPPLPPVALVNCNRQGAHADFVRAYEAQGGHPAQFYFFAGCPSQKPASFSERVVYEIVHEVLSDNKTAIFYDIVEEEIGPRRVERLLVRPLPYANFGACQTQFQACVAEMLASYRQHLPEQGGDISVDGLVDMPAGQLPVQLFTLAFRIDFAELAWGDKLRDYLRWIVTTFHQRRFTPPAFQFVFLVQANGHHRQPDPSVQALAAFLKTLNAELNGGQPDAPYPCAWSEQFQPVSPQQLEDWLRLRYKVDPGTSALRSSVDRFVEQLRRTNRLGPNNAIDMADAEDFAKMVYAASHSPAALLSP